MQSRQEAQRSLRLRLVSTVFPPETQPRSDFPEAPIRQLHRRSKHTREAAHSQLEITQNPPEHFATYLFTLN